MKTIAEKNYKISSHGNKWNNLNVSIYYDLGGMNYFSGKVEKRGYYFSITPEELSRGFRSYTAYSGGKTLIKEVKRQTKKQDQTMAEMMNELIDRFVPDFCARKGIILEQ